jgi:UV DNA damage endonuclease
MVNLGYCCINTELDSKGIRVNRGMIKRTFEQRGLDYVSELTILNLVDCLEILKWNKGGGKILSGLTKRRVSESILL